MKHNLYFYVPLISFLANQCSTENLTAWCIPSV